MTQHNFTHVFTHRLTFVRHHTRQFYNTYAVHHIWSVYAVDGRQLNQGFSIILWPRIDENKQQITNAYYLLLDGISTLFCWQFERFVCCSELFNHVFDVVAVLIQTFVWHNFIATIDASHVPSHTMSAQPIRPTVVISIYWLNSL